MKAKPVKQEAILFLAWSRVFSPFLEESLREEAWTQLEVPGSFASSQESLWATFHIGLPQPTATLLIHALVGSDGGRMREDIVRVLDYLGLDWGERRLPPDHLSCVLELLAVAIEADEPVLVKGLCDRHLLPWCAEAAQCVPEDTGMAEVVDKLHADLVTSFAVGARA